MSFDPRSLERLRKLGRQIPKPLSEPEPPAKPKARQVRHKVETEQNPEQLFRELMQVSQDGTVPEHLMDRLKRLEGQRSSRPVPSTADGTTAEAVLPPPPGAQSQKGKNTRPKRPDVAPGSEEESLYVAFGQMFHEMLEDDGEEV